MKLFNLKNAPSEIEIKLNIAEFMPDADIDEDSIINGSFFLALKFQFIYLTKSYYPKSTLNFSRFPVMKINGSDNDYQCMNYLTLVLNRINDNADDIIKNIVEKRKYISFDDIKEEFDQYIVQQIRNESKNQKIKFLDIKRKSLEIKVEFDLKELSHLNVLQSFNFINSARIALQNQFENYHRSYCPHEEINIENQPDFIIRCNNEKTLDYFVGILNKVNNQSNYLYEQVLNDNTGDLKDFFASFLNGFISQEILKDQLPITSSVNKKKNKL
jgi:hypothetical protein